MAAENDDNGPWFLYDETLAEGDGEVEDKSVVRVRVNDSVTLIPDHAFPYCISLREIKIPTSVVSIGEWAFYRCSSLTEIQLPTSVTSIGDYAFRFCFSLQSIRLPGSITSIGEGVFWDCRALTTVELPNGIEQIPLGTFSNCRSLVTIRIPDAVQSIDRDAFLGCAGLTELNLPSSLTSVGGWAFRGCTALTRIVLPNSVAVIGYHAFYACTSLTRIVVPNSVAVIGEGAFGNCSALEIVRLPNNPNLAIGDGAFADCDALTTLELPRMELAVWPRLLEQFNSNCLFERIGLEDEVGRQTCAFSFLRKSAPQLFEKRIIVQGLGFEEAEERLSGIGLDLQEFRDGIGKATICTGNNIAAGVEGVETRFSNVQTVEFRPDHVNLTGYIWFFDCKIRFDVKLDLDETKRLHNLTFQSLGWRPPDFSREYMGKCNQFIHASPIQIKKLREIDLAGRGRDVNARDSLPLFLYIFQRAPEARESIRPIVLAIHAPREFTEQEVSAFLQILNLTQVLWQKEWHMHGAGGATLTMAATPSDDSWPGIVRLVLTFFAYDEFSQESFFSLTAEGFVNFAGCRIMLGRIFPFIITLDHEYETVQKKLLAELLFTPESFDPKIIVDSEFSSKTGETPDATRELVASTFDIESALTTRMWCPNGASVKDESVPITTEPR